MTRRVSLPSRERLVFESGNREISIARKIVPLTARVFFFSSFSRTRSRYLQIAAYRLSFMRLISDGVFDSRHIASSGDLYARIRTRKDTGKDMIERSNVHGIAFENIDRVTSHDFFGLWRLQCPIGILINVNLAIKCSVYIPICFLRTNDRATISPKNRYVNKPFSCDI